jgi:hypothetical protein
MLCSFARCLLSKLSAQSSWAADCYLFTIYDMHMEFWVISLYYSGPVDRDGSCITESITPVLLLMMAFLLFGYDMDRLSELNGFRLTWALIGNSRHFHLFASRDTPLHNMHVVVRLWTLICH